MAQLMPLPLTVSCFSKIQIGFTFLVPAHPASPRQRAVKRVCVCCVCGAQVDQMLIDHAWISEEKKYFGQANTAYDFKANDPKEAGRRIQKLQEKKDKLSKSVNMRAMNMLGKAEEQVGLLHQQMFHRFIYILLKTFYSIQCKRNLHTDKNTIQKIYYRRLMGRIQPSLT